MGETEALPVTALFGTHTTMGTQRAALVRQLRPPGTSGCGRGGGDSWGGGLRGGPRGGGSPQPRVPAHRGSPQAAPRRLKCRGLHLRARFPPQAPGQAVLGVRRDPALFPARLIPHSPRGHLPSSGKTRWRNARRSRSREGAIAAASPVAPRRCEERASRRAGPPHW